ncbi:hypothetical protein [Pseudoduganella umbonata]|uniref:Uncharacterized protein n=1 Tax=Pseudoduganella umbonata TaxID=864828 RepID=A0A7W5HCS3_9BURK|nr:hypothetical protein [Pseudoduganella umbonata]MBB3221964.1 hypothetical protein [Pseudoduganella umbonata]
MHLLMMCCRYGRDDVQSSSAGRLQLKIELKKFKRLRSRESSGRVRLHLRGRSDSTGRGAPEFPVKGIFPPTSGEHESSVNPIKSDAIYDRQQRTHH